MSNEELSLLVEDFFKTHTNPSLKTKVIPFMLSLVDSLVDSSSSLICNVTPNAFEDVGRVVMYHSFFESGLVHLIRASAPGVSIDFILSENNSGKLKLARAQGVSKQECALYAQINEVRNKAVHNLELNPKVSREQISDLMFAMSKIESDGFPPNWKNSLTDVSPVYAYCLICLAIGFVNSLRGRLALSAQAASVEMTTEEIVDRINRIRNSAVARALVETTTIKSADFAILDMLTLFKGSPSKITGK